MSVLIRVDGRKAIYRSGKWFSSDVALEASLNQLTDQWISTTGGPPIEERDQELAIAAEVANRSGGKVKLHYQSESKRTAAVLFSKRQMKFDFSTTPRRRRAGRAQGATAG